MAATYKDLYMFLMSLNSAQMNEEAVITLSTTDYTIKSMQVVGKEQFNGGLVNVYHDNPAPIGANMETTTDATNDFNLSSGGIGTVEIIIQ